ncbi:MAG: hypothetical protein JOZ33_07950 [Acidobacteriaceae bacterium]|nr:hypothetical protein [Acidobacteriaceae bacterium]
MYAETSPDVLTCWKDIAHYFGKGVRTVQRWERCLGLPVRRPSGVDHKTAVVAYPRDLEIWLQSRWSRRAIEDQSSHPATDRRMLCAEISDGLRVSRELQGELRTLRKENRELIDQLASSLNVLRQNCLLSSFEANCTPAYFESRR